MTFTKEIEITTGEISTNDLCAELEERLEDCGFIYTEEFQKQCEPKVKELLSNLNEIRLWLEHPNQRLQMIGNP